MPRSKAHLRTRRAGDRERNFAELFGRVVMMHLVIDS